MRTVVPFLWCTVVVSPFARSAAQEPARDPVPAIVTQGRGEVTVVPDRATVTLAVESRAPTAAEAGRRNAAVARAVQDTLRSLGIPDPKLRTTGFSVSPEYRYPGEGRAPQVVGYIARNAVRAELDRTEQAGPAVDAGLAKGATSVSGLTFWASNTDDARREALRLAVEKARADADVMARAAGGSVAGLLELSSQADLDAPLPRMEAAMMRADAAEPPTPVQAGEQRVSVVVSARWRFQPR
jgi:hypothetical protein